MADRLERTNTTAFYRLSVRERGEKLFGDRRVPTNGGLGMIDLDQQRRLEEAVASVHHTASDPETTSRGFSRSVRLAQREERKARRATQSAFPPAATKPPAFHSTTPLSRPDTSLQTVVAAPSENNSPPSSPLNTQIGALSDTSDGEAIFSSGGERKSYRKKSMMRKAKDHANKSLKSMKKRKKPTASPSTSLKDSSQPTLAAPTHNGTHGKRVRFASKLELSAKPIHSPSSELSSAPEPDKTTPPTEPQEAPPKQKSERCCLSRCFCAIWNLFLCLFTFGLCGRSSN